MGTGGGHRTSEQGVCDRRQGSGSGQSGLQADTGRAATQGRDAVGGQDQQQTRSQEKMVEATLLVPYMLGSSLNKRIQMAEDSFNTLVGEHRVRVVEAG